MKKNVTENLPVKRRVTVTIHIPIPETLSVRYPFFYQATSAESKMENGWDLFNIDTYFAKIVHNTQNWRISRANDGYKVVKLPVKLVSYFGHISQRAKMWWNRGTRFPENFWEFSVAQKIFETELLCVSYLINSATLFSYLPQKIMIVALFIFCALV